MKKSTARRPEYEHRPEDPPHRLTRTRRLTAAEAAHYRKLREAVMEEFPPAPGSPAAVAVGLRALLRKLRKAREAQGLSLAAVARRSGMDRTAVCRLEMGRQPNPTVDTLYRYAAALGKRLGWVVEDVSGEKA
jgi:DNA-binding XRE family transcriptional regulator